MNYMDSDSPRNTILLPQSLDRHFEKKDICFDYNFLTKTLVCNVVNPNIMDLPLWVNTSTKPPTTIGALTLGSIHQKSLALPKGKFPFRRLLNHHAEFAHRQADLRAGHNTAREQYGRESEESNDDEKKKTKEKGPYTQKHLRSKPKLMELQAAFKEATLTEVSNTPPRSTSPSPAGSFSAHEPEPEPIGEEPTNDTGKKKKKHKKKKVV